LRFLYNLRGARAPPSSVPMRTNALLIACAVSAALWGSAAQSANLLEVFEQASRNDPSIQEADQRRLAALEAKPQARGALFPQIGIGGSIETSERDGSGTFLQAVDDDNQPGTPPEIAILNVDQRISADTWQWQAGLRQTVFRWDQWQRLGRADARVAQAEAEYRAAQQDLMVRVSQRYFDVLAAAETLRSAEATLDAFEKQLREAERRFEVGVVTVIDVEEARSARDIGSANVIAAKRALAVTGELLAEVTGELYPELSRPKEDLPVSDPEQRGEQAWVDEALEQNLTVIASRLGVEIAKRDVKIAQSGHLPTVDLFATTGEFDESATETVTNRTLDTRTRGPADSDGTEDVVGLQLAVPLFTGGVTSSRVREQVYLHRASRQRLQGSLRAAERSTRDAYLTVLSDKARVEALAQAVKSSETAVRATIRGVEVGERTNVDVLSARRQLFDAERDYARARYDYLINLVRLRSAVGVLLPSDLASINAYLVEPISVTPTGSPRR
jgi:outer membrane protein